MSVDTRYPLVSIVFPNWNGRDDTLECLESIRCLDYPLDRVEVIVVDNASQDGSQQAITDKLDRLENDGLGRGVLVELAENIGPAGASNVGLSKVTRKWIISSESTTT